MAHELVRRQYVATGSLAQTMTWHLLDTKALLEPVWVIASKFSKNSP